MSGPLSGKRALVTGASSALGKGIATRLAEEGATVCLNGRNAERLEQAAEELRGTGAQVATVVGSLSDDISANKVAEGAIAALGGIDILVNNAGGESAGNGSAPWFDVTSDNWRDTFNSNLVSMTRLIRALVPAMQERKWGRVINLSSNSVDIPMVLIPDYQAAKAAIRSMTRSLAMTVATDGVTVNCVSPGLTHSNGPDRWIREMAEANGWTGDWEDIRKQASEHITYNFVKRIGTPEEVAHAVAFLADPRASMVNGINVTVDGGH